MPKLPLTLACWNYDRTRALMDGRVTVEGVELNYLNLVVEETFFRMLRNREFDVAEMSLSSYTLSLFQEPAPFIAIPVWDQHSRAEEAARTEAAMYREMWQEADDCDAAGKAAVTSAVRSAIGFIAAVKAHPSLRQRHP